MPQPRYYPKVSRPPTLQPREIEFLDWLDWFIPAASAHAMAVEMAEARREFRFDAGGCERGREGPSSQVNTLTARATTSPRTASEISDCTPMAILAHGARGSTSVGLNAVDDVSPRYR